MSFRINKIDFSNYCYYIYTSEKLFKASLEHSFTGYYLSFPEGNDILFKKLFFERNKVDFIIKILGYYNGGIFPYCKTKDDVRKLLNALMTYSKIKEEW